MAHIKLTLQEIYKLDSELNGFINPSTGETLLLGLLNEKLNLITKYWLTDLSKHVNVEKIIIEDLKAELVKKYGDKDENGNFEIPIWIDDNKSKFNPSYIQFQEEFNTLLQEEKEIEYHEFKLDDFKNIETSNNYTIFYKLIQVD
jgi:hypothetical protein